MESKPSILTSSSWIFTSILPTLIATFDIGILIYFSMVLVVLRKFCFLNLALVWHWHFLFLSWYHGKNFPWWHQVQTMMRFFTTLYTYYLWQFVESKLDIRCWSFTVVLFDGSNTSLSHYVLEFGCWECKSNWHPSWNRWYSTMLGKCMRTMFLSIQAPLIHIEVGFLYLYKDCIVNCVCLS